MSQLLPSKKVKGKRKGRFNPSIQISNDSLTTKAVDLWITSTTQVLTTRVEELEVELIIQANQTQKEKSSLNEKISFLLSEIGKLDTFPLEEHTSLVEGILPDNRPYIHLH